MNFPLVSIIIPLYNKESSIRSTIDSVLNQKFSNFEIVVVDDGSTDNSSTIVKNINDNRIHYYYKDNEGVSVARNYGVQKAFGEWVMFLDADDVLLDSAIDTLLGPINALDIDVCCGNFYIMRNNKKTLYSSWRHNGCVKNKYLNYYLNNFCPRTGCCIIKKNIAERFSYDGGLKKYEDLKVILDMFSIAKIYYTTAPIMVYRTSFSCLSNACDNLSCDFSYTSNFSSYPFWGKMILGELLYNALKIYPSKRICILKRKKRYLVFLFSAFLKRLVLYFRK